jgi:malate dehydrogenase (oxaloacetate-decarboxylating)
MKMAAAKAIAGVVGDERSPEYVIPSVFDNRVGEAVAKAVIAAAAEEGIARRAVVVHEEERVPAGV